MNLTEPNPEGKESFGFIPQEYPGSDDPRFSHLTIESSVKVVSTRPRASFTMIKAYLGVGILSLPFNFAKLGLGPSLLLFFIAGILNYAGMTSMLKVCDTIYEDSMDYPRVAKIVLGKSYRNFVEMNLIILLMGSAMASTVFSMQFSSQILCNLEMETLCNNHWYQYGFFLLIILGSATVTDLHYLSLPTSISIVLQFIFLCAFVIKMISLIAVNGVYGGSFVDLLFKFDIKYLPIAIGAFVYAFEGIGCMLEVRNTLRDHQGYWKVLNLSYSIITAAYLLVGTLGALGLGDNITEIVFMSLPQTKFFLFVEASFIIGIILGIQTNIFPAIRLIENWKIFRRVVADPDTGRKSGFGRILIRYGVNLLCFAAAMWTPSFNLLIAFLGSINETVICFIMPALLFLARFPNLKNTLLGITNRVNMVLATIVGMIGSVLNFWTLIKYNSSEDL